MSTILKYVKELFRHTNNKIGTVAGVKLLFFVKVEM